MRILKGIAFLAGRTKQKMAKTPAAAVRAGEKIIGDIREGWNKGVKEDTPETTPKSETENTPQVSKDPEIVVIE